MLKSGLGRYLLRTGTMFATTLALWLIVLDYHLCFLIADRKRGGHLRGMWRVVKYLYGPRHGMFPRIAGEWLSFFRPGFHPWDHDNRAQLARIDGLVAAVDATNEASDRCPQGQATRRAGSRLIRDTLSAQAGDLRLADYVGGPARRAAYRAAARPLCQAGAVTRAGRLARRQSSHGN